MCTEPADYLVETQYIPKVPVSHIIRLSASQYWQIRGVIKARHIHYMYTCITEYWDVQSNHMLHFHDIVHRRRQHWVDA